ncbi:MAG: hypothetical protein SAK29_31985 [Scytonema sp. PMC 1069.18]|nr:hypothetical protein [Scytonema sp. PMC 1069.18]MEC4885089.1 hypothetical protein [Scytonema sp. PMC 1070.18]
MQVLQAIAPSQKSSVNDNLVGFEFFESASVDDVKFAFWLKKQKELLKPKQFKELLQERGILRPEANKFLKLAENAKDFDPEDLAGLGPMMFSLTAPKYKPLWEALQDIGPLTQEVVNTRKKELFPTKKASKSDPPSIWRQKPGGGERYCQIPPIHDQDIGVKLQGMMDEEGLSAQAIVGEGIALREAYKQGRLVYQEFKNANSTGKEAQHEPQQYVQHQEEEKEPQAITDGEIGEPAVLINDEQDAAQAELNGDTDLARQEEPVQGEISDTPRLITEEADEIPLSPPILPTERYKKVWKEGDVAIANTTSENFMYWCEGKPVTIQQVSSEVGSIQTLKVIRHDGQTCTSFGNWIEEVPGSDDENSGNEPSQFETKPEATIDYANLSDSLKKATDWQEIEQLTECDRTCFAKVVKDWSIKEKQVLVKHLTAYLETNSEALRLHQLDWVSLPSLEKAFKNLSFKVRDIQEGLSAPWVSGCRFISVADFGNDSEEVWIFISPTQQIIKVFDREDFQVVGF